MRPQVGIATTHLHHLLAFALREIVILPSLAGALAGEVAELGL